MEFKHRTDYVKAKSQLRKGLEDFNRSELLGFLKGLIEDFLRNAEQENRFTDDFTKLYNDMVELIEDSRISKKDLLDVFLVVGGRMKRVYWKDEKIGEIRRLREVEKNLIENLENLLLLLANGGIETAREFTFTWLENAKKALDELDGLEWELLVGDGVVVKDLKRIVDAVKPSMERPVYR